MQCGPAGKGLWHQRRILGVVAESALTMKESRRVMILTPDGDVYVEDASGQGMEIEGIWWSDNLTLPCGIRSEGACAFRRELRDVQFAALRRPQRLRHGLTSIGANRVTHPVDGVWWSLRRLQGLPSERGPCSQTCEKFSVSLQNCCQTQHKWEAQRWLPSFSPGNGPPAQRPRDHRACKFL